MLARTWPALRSARPPPHARRRCLADRATRPSVSRPDAPGGRPGRRTGPRLAGARPRRSTSVRAEALGPGRRTGASRTCPALLALDREPAPIPAGHPLVAQLERRLAGRPDPAHGRRPRVARPGHPRAEGDRPGGPPRVARAHPRPRRAGARSARMAAPARSVAGHAGRRSPTTPITRSGSSSGGPTSSGGSPPAQPGSRRSPTCRSPTAYARLTAVPGIGPWTAAEVGVRALGDEDAVSVGDFHLPNLVAYALAREPRGTDDRMLELLEPYRGAARAGRPAARAERHPGTTLRPAPVRPADRGPLAASARAEPLDRLDEGRDRLGRARLE